MFLSLLKKIFLIICPTLLLANTTLEADFCVDKISGFIYVEADNCTFYDVEVTIYDSLHQVIKRVKTDSNGMYNLYGKFPCGNYSAKLTANVPECFEYLSGDQGPVSFVIREDNTGVNFLFRRLITTKYQWLILCFLTIAMVALAYFFKAFKISTEGELKEYPFFNFFHIPFHLGIYKFMLFLTSMLIMIGFAICLLIYHSAFYSDIIGTIMAGPIFAYLLHILYIVEAEG